MPKIIDTYCRDCGTETYDVHLAQCDAATDPCACGGETRVLWSRGIAPQTDVFGREKWSIAAGCYVRSQREQDRIMREAGFEPSGDKVHGARNSDHQNLGKSFSYHGQTKRRVLEVKRQYDEQ